MIVLSVKAIMELLEGIVVLTFLNSCEACILARLRQKKVVLEMKCLRTVTGMR